MWASAENCPLVNRFDKFMLKIVSLRFKKYLFDNLTLIFIKYYSVEDFNPTVDVPLTESFSGSPATVGRTMLPSRKMLDLLKSILLPVKVEPRILLGQNEILSESSFSPWKDE